MVEIVKKDSNSKQFFFYQIFNLRCKTLFVEKIGKSCENYFYYESSFRCIVKGPNVSPKRLRYRD